MYTFGLTIGTTSEAAKGATIDVCLSIATGQRKAEANLAGQVEIEVYMQGIGDHVVGAADLIGDHPLQRRTGRSSNLERERSFFDRGGSGPGGAA